MDESNAATIRKKSVQQAFQDSRKHQMEFVKQTDGILLYENKIVSCVVIFKVKGLVLFFLFLHFAQQLLKVRGLVLFFMHSHFKSACPTHSDPKSAERV